MSSDPDLKVGDPVARATHRTERNGKKTFIRLAKSESKLYWSQPFDKVTTKGGWEEKAPPCTR